MIYTIEEARRIIGVHNRIHGSSARSRKDADRLGAPRTWTEISQRMAKSAETMEKIETRKELADIEKLLNLS